MDLGPLTGHNPQPPLPLFEEMPQLTATGTSAGAHFEGVGFREGEGEGIPE